MKTLELTLGGPESDYRARLSGNMQPEAGLTQATLCLGQYIQAGRQGDGEYVERCRRGVPRPSAESPARNTSGGNISCEWLQPV
jgi:hypothetical protein